MRQDADLNRSKQTVPQWIGKQLFCVLTGRSYRSIDYKMASGRLTYRKFPSGMVRFRASDAIRRIDLHCLQQKNVNNFLIVEDRINATDLADIHDVSPETVRDWAAQGIVPHVKNSAGAASFNPEAVEEALTRFDVSFLDDIHSGDDGRIL